MTAHAIRTISAGLLVALTVVAAGCEPRAGTGGDADDGWRGSVMSRAKPRPDFVLTDTRGEPYDFRDETSGRLTFLFFGYTHCPDVCPVHMANLAAVLREESPEVRERVEVVFVTTDPERDTPERLRSWLDGFSRRFVGLRGTRDEINEIESSLGLPASMIQEDPRTGEPLVGHSARMLAFTADDSAHVGYPFGTRQLDLARDLPRLLDGWRGS